MRTVTPCRLLVCDPGSDHHLVPSWLLRDQTLVHVCAGRDGGGAATLAARVLGSPHCKGAFLSITDQIVSQYSSWILIRLGNVGDAHETTLRQYNCVERNMLARPQRQKSGTAET